MSWSDRQPEVLELARPNSLAGGGERDGDPNIWPTRERP
jgi:hypothetical protein